MNAFSVSSGFVLGIIAGFIANYITPRLTTFVNQKISTVFNLLNPDRYDITGTWEQIFTEPNPNGTLPWIPENETIRLKHLGNIITGTGQTKRLPRTFYYDLKANHNMVFGSYVKKGEKGNITGAGMTQLMVSPDRLEMKGQATWFDNDTKQIESSEVNWKKIS